MKIIDLIEPRYQDDFRQYVKTRRASDEFRNYLNSSHQVQRALSIAEERQERILREMSDFIMER